MNQAQLGDPAYVAEMQLENVFGTDVWYRSYRMRCDARFTYKLAENLQPRPLGSLPPADRQAYLDTFVIDPLNRRGQFETLMGPASIVELPNAPAQPLMPVPEPRRLT